MEIINYIRAFRSLRHSVNGKIIYNPTDTDIYFTLGKKEFIVKKGETITP